MSIDNLLRPIARFAVIFSITSLCAVVNPLAQADFYNSNYLPLTPGRYYKYFDQSASGSVIVTAAGCKTCSLVAPNSGASISTNGGGSFSNLSIPNSSWRGVDISSDGQTIAIATSDWFYISTNSGSSFTLVDATPFGLFSNSDEITASTLSNDGKTVYIAISGGYIRKFQYNSAERRWGAVLDRRVDGLNAYTMATNSDGSKLYIGYENGSIVKLFGTTLSTVPNTNLYQGSESFNWTQIRTSDSGNEVIALARPQSAGGLIYRSYDSGTTWSAFTTINNVGIGDVRSVEISPDGQASFFSRTNYESGLAKTTFFTQHGKNAQWYSRLEHWNELFEAISSNEEGSQILTSHLGYQIRILKGTPESPLIQGVSMSSSSSIQVEWGFNYTPATDPGNAISDAILEYATSSSGPWTTFNDGVVAGNSGTIEVTGLNARTLYYFRVKTRSPYGTSAPSAVRSGFIYEKPSTPNAPERLARSDESVLPLKFGVPVDFGGASSITDTDWQYSTDGGVTWNDSSTATFNYTTSYVSDGLAVGEKALLISEYTPGATLNVRTRSYNGYLWSNWSPDGSYVIYKKPSAVRNLQVSTVYTTSTLTWDAPADLGGSTISEYQYAYKLSSDTAWSMATTTSRTATISGLVGGSLYDYYVAAVSARGQQSIVAYVYNGQTVNPPTKLAINRNSAGAKSRAAFTTQPKISLLDTNNTLVTDESKAIVSAEVNKGGLFIGVETATALSGIATFSNLGLKGVAGTVYTITYRSGTLLPITETITLQAGEKYSMRFTQKTVGGRNNVIFPTQAAIELLDREGNRVTSDTTTTITLNTSSGFLWDGVNSSPVATSSNGVASFSGVKISGGNGATAVLTYTSSGLTALQETITITTGPAATFTRTTRAADAYVGSQFGTQPEYQVTDSAGNIVTTGEYYITISPSQGTLTGNTTVTTINGVATFRDLGIKGVAANQMVILSVSSPGFTTYTGDSVITRQGFPLRGWSDVIIPRTLSSIVIPVPETRTAGTFTYFSSNTNVITISGGNAIIVGSGTATVTATFIPFDTTSFIAQETITSTFTVNPGASTLIVSTSGGSTVSKGLANSITATSSDAGIVTFFSNGKRIPGCVAIKTQTLIATCSWKPSLQGTATITAILVPNNVSLSPVRATPINLSVSRRTGRR